MTTETETLGAIAALGLEWLDEDEWLDEAMALAAGVAPADLSMTGPWWASVVVLPAEDARRIDDSTAWGDAALVWDAGPDEEGCWRVIVGRGAQRAVIALDDAEDPDDPPIRTAARTARQWSHRTALDWIAYREEGR